MPDASDKPIHSEQRWRYVVCLRAIENVENVGLKSDGANNGISRFFPVQLLYGHSLSIPVFSSPCVCRGCNRVVVTSGGELVRQMSLVQLIGLLAQQLNYTALQCAVATRPGTAVTSTSSVMCGDSLRRLECDSTGISQSIL